MDIISKNSFARILTLLRKEKNISQKQVASDLNISQALLSHYEKGIRECKLDFVLKVADYYDVSIDYLLGRAPEKSGLKLSLDGIPSGEDSNDKHFRNNIIATLNKKLIINSINIIFDVLQKINSKAFLNVVSEYLMISVYKMFRVIFSANSRNPESFFSLDKDMYSGMTTAKQSIDEAKANCLAKGKKIGESFGLNKNQQETVQLSPENISNDYPMLSSSICNLINNVEKNIVDREENERK